MKKIMSVMAVLFVLITKAYSSVNVYHDSPYIATVHVVHQYYAGSMLFSSGDYQSSEEDVDIDMPSGGSLYLPDEWSDLGPYLDGDNWVQLREEWLYICFNVQLYSNGGGGGDYEPPLVASGAETSFDENADFEIIGGGTTAYDHPNKQVTLPGGRATLKMSTEIKYVSSNQVISSLSTNTMPPAAAGATQSAGILSLSTSDINVEPVPGQNNTFRGTAMEITLKSVIAYNPVHFVGGRPTDSTQYAEYQHYNEYSSRMEALTASIDAILAAPRFGDAESAKRAILREIKVANALYLYEATEASKRFDADNLDPNDPDVGTHRGDLNRKVRMYEDFPNYWEGMIY